MVTVTVGARTIGPFELDAVPESGINRAVNRRVDDGLNPCVRVLLDEGSVELPLQTKACGGGGDGTDASRGEQESAILELWKKRVFDQPEVRGGHVNAFLKQVRKLV